MEPGFVQQLLSQWEQGYHQSVVWRGLYLLAIARPELSLDELAAMPIGERDGRLLNLHEQLFGPNIQAVSNCPTCDQMIEINCRVSDIALLEQEEAKHEGRVNVAGKEIPFRLPNSLDLLAIVGQSDPKQAQQMLLWRCLQQVSKRQQKAWQKHIPDRVQTAVSNQMAALDPQGNIEMALTCPACRHQWQTLFDIVTFLWAEVDRWAIRTMQDIHTLAKAYGWSEQDILNLSPWRRQLYLQMVTG